MKNDIMILKWSNQLTFNNYVRPINLPSAGITQAIESIRIRSLTWSKTKSSSSTASSFTTCAYGYDGNNRDTKELTCFTGILVEMIFHPQAKNSFLILCQAPRNHTQLATLLPAGMDSSTLLINSASKENQAQREHAFTMGEHQVGFN